MTMLVVLTLAATELPEGAYPAASVEEFVGPSEGTANDRPWWYAFDDPALTDAIDRALANNYDLEAAAARIVQAEARAMQALAPLLPSLTADGSLNGSRAAALGFQFGFGGGDGPSVVYNGSATLNARWQLDIFGRSYLAYRAAELREEASVGNRDAVALSLANQVAAAYFDVVFSKNAIELIEEQIDANAKLLEILELRFERGDTAGLDVLQQKQQYASRAAELPPLRSQLEAAQQRLAVLLGDVPQDVPPKTAEALPPLPETPTLGKPNDLLENRPDLHAQLLQAEAANKQHSSAKRVHLPTLSANANWGYRYFRLDESSTTRDWGGGLSLSLPLFSGFGDVGQVKEARATAEDALNGLSQAYLVAVQEVETAAINEREVSKQLALLREASEAADAALEESKARYVNGLTNYIAVLTALTAAQTAERAVLQAERSAIAARLQLYQALGGPWTQSVGVSAGGDS